MKKQKITSIVKAKLEKQLEEHQKGERDAMERLTAAKELGDLSENSEADAARDDLSRHRTKIAEIENTLQNSEVCGETSGDIIDIGTFFNLYIIKEDGKEEFRGLYMMDSVEDILGGIIGETSPLGQQIKGNVSGIYNVQTAFKSLRYRVEKQPASKSKEFLETYSSMHKLFE